MATNEDLNRMKEKTKSFLRSYPVVVGVAAGALVSSVVSARSAKKAVRKGMGDLKIELWLAPDPNHPENRQQVG